MKALKHLPIYSVIFTLILSACKKNYNCVCDVNGTENTVSGTLYASKKRANDLCNSLEKNNVITTDSIIRIDTIKTDTTIIRIDTITTPKIVRIDSTTNCGLEKR